MGSTASGHSEWVDGKAYHIGFTTSFAPNTYVGCVNAGVTYDIDFLSQNEGSTATEISYAAVTARSYHRGMVNTAMMDGSVRPAADDIELRVWQALSTRAGGELVSDEF